MKPSQYKYYGDLDRKQQAFFKTALFSTVAKQILIFCVFPTYDYSKLTFCFCLYIKN
jgi:hypothetical protein